MSFPNTRPLRLRRNKAIRSLVAQTTLRLDKLILPLFVVEGSNINEPIKAMPGFSRLSVDLLVEEAQKIFDMGISSVILFGIPSKKDSLAKGAYNREGIIPTAIVQIKKKVPDLLVWADVCLCEYTDTGHCCLFSKDLVDNDSTLDLLCKASVVYAQAGADIIAPSDMMDGRVIAIRHALDKASLIHIPIASYSVKYASAFYGPFREAAKSTPSFGDRKCYQMDPSNSFEALKEVALDLEEGADLIIVKPALSYLDIISKVKEHFKVPTIAYNVSGEYSMVKAAAQNGWIDHDKVILEILTSITRAGADAIITYFAKDAARLLERK